jgi:hypothetical protein
MLSFRRDVERGARQMRALQLTANISYHSIDGSADTVKAKTQNLLSGERPLLDPFANECCDARSRHTRHLGRLAAR